MLFGGRLSFFPPEGSLQGGYKFCYVVARVVECTVSIWLPGAWVQRGRARREHPPRPLQQRPGCPEAALPSSSACSSHLHKPVTVITTPLQPHPEVKIKPTKMGNKLVRNDLCTTVGYCSFFKISTGVDTHNIRNH